MPAPAKKPPADPLLTQAQNAAAVRFGPEQSTLQGLLDQAQSDLLAGAKIQASTATSIRAAVDAARPQLEQVYADARSQSSQAQHDLEGDLGKLDKGSSSGFGQASAREAAAATGRLAAAGAMAQGELINKGVQAEAGRAYGLRALLSQYQGDVGKIRGRMDALSQEAGAFTTDTAAKLRAEREKAIEDAKDRAIREAGVTGTYQGQPTLGAQKTQADLDRDRYQREHGVGPYAPPAGSKPKSNAATPEANRSFVAGVNKIWSFLKPLPVKSRGSVTGAIKSGITKSGTGSKAVSLPSVSDPLFAQAAYDLVQYTRLQSATYHQLRAAGYAIPRGWMPRPAAPPRRPDAQGNVSVGG